MPTPTPMIISGFWEAPSGVFITPTGAPKVSEVDGQYITKAEFVQTLEAQGVGITAASPIYSSGMLDKYLVNASKFATTFCRQYFDTQTIDEYKDHFTVKPLNPEMVPVHTHNAPINGLNSMYIQVLNWFIQIHTNPSVATPYIQIEPDWGMIKIVPLLSSAGVGTGSPIPAEIINHIDLAKLWYNYTFGYSTTITGYTLPAVGASTTQFQPSDYNYQLWARSQTLNVYANGVLQPSTAYTVDYANGIVTFGTAPTGPITADFTTNNSIPFDIKIAVTKYACKLIAQATQNPGGFESVNITGYSANFMGENAGFIKEIKEMLEPYKRNQFHFF